MVSAEHRDPSAVESGELTFRALVEQLPGNVFVHRDGIVLYANPAMVAWLGYVHASEITGRTVFDTFLHPEERVRVEERFRHVRDGTAGLVFDARLVRRDGSVRTVESTTVRLDFDGGPASVILVHDVTDERAMRQRILISDRMASMGTLAAGAAHEINNPLTFVISNLEVLRDDLRDLRSELPKGRLEAMESMIGEALEGADRVRKIVHGMKAFSRPEETRSPVDLRNVIELAITLSANAFKYRAQLVRDYGPTPAVQGNEGQLGQVFINLLVNAAQAIPEGDFAGNVIRISTSTDASGRAVVEVSDTGAGIAPDVLGRIFDPFFTTKPIGVGTGLGLSICHGIVTSHGGEIFVESTEGEGSTFRVVLPAGAPSTLQRPSAPPESNGDGKVLVVDDHPIVAASLKQVLRREFDVTVVNTGREVLQRIRHGEHFDVVLCDLMMPGMTGMEVYAEATRTHPSFRERFVFMTGGATTIEAHAFLKTVSNPCLEKPLHALKVRDLLRSLVRRSDVAAVRTAG